MHEIRIVFKSGREEKILLYGDESFEAFWKRAVKDSFFISGDVMFRVDEIEYSETVD